MKASKKFFKQHSFYQPDIEPEIITRPEIDKNFENAIYGLSGLICIDNFVDIVKLLSKIHFYRNVPASALFEWLSVISKATPDLTERVTNFKEFVLGRRVLGQRHMKLIAN